MNYCKRIKNIFQVMIVFLVFMFCYDVFNNSAFCDDYKNIWFQNENDPLKNDIGFACDKMGEKIYDYYDTEALAISMSHFEKTGRTWDWHEETSDEMIEQYMKLGKEAQTYGIESEDNCDYYKIVTKYNEDDIYIDEYNTMKGQANKLIELYQKRNKATAKEKVQTPDGNIIGDSEGSIEKISKGDKLILTLEYGDELLEFINVTVKKDGFEVYNSDTTNKFEYTFSEKGKYYIEYNYSYLYAARYTEYMCAGSCTDESGKKESKHMEYQLGFMWRIKTYEITIEDVANVSITKHVANITNNGNWLSEGTTEYLHSQEVYNTNNEKGYRWKSGGKVGTAVADVGDYVYFLIEVKNEETKGDKVIVTISDSFDNYGGDFIYKKYNNSKWYGPWGNTDKNGKFSTTASVDPGETEKIYVRVRLTKENMKDENESYLYSDITNTVEITSTKIDGKEVNNKNKNTKDSDKVLCRKYEVQTDMFISGVGFKNYTEGRETKSNFTEGSDCELHEYKTNGSTELWSDIGKGKSISGSSTIRSDQSTAAKNDSPAYVELGDYVEYTVKATNKENDKNYLKGISEEKISEYGVKIKLNVKLPDNRNKNLTNNGLVKVYFGNNPVTDFDLETGKTIYKIERNKDGTINIEISCYDKGVSIGDTFSFIFIIPTDEEDDKYRLGTSNFAEAFCDIKSIKNRNNVSVSNINKYTLKKDYYAVKEYDVSVDSYITNVSHTNGNTNLYWTEDINGTTDGYRSRLTNAVKGQALAKDATGKVTKNNNSAYIERGDEVEYTVHMINTSGKDTAGGILNPSVDRAILPWKEPHDVTVNVKFELPSGVSITSCIATEQINGTYNVTVKDNKITGLNIGWSDYTELKLMVSTNTVNNRYDNLKEIKATVTKVTNINGEQGYNTATVNKRSDGVAYNTSSDYFRVKEYNVGVDYFISNSRHTVNDAGKEQNTFGCESRKYQEITSKADEPVYTEYGDDIYYDIYIYNTKNDNKEIEFYNVTRDDAPYRKPENVTVDLVAKLPQNYSSIEIVEASHTALKNSNILNIDSSDKTKLYINGLPISTNGYIWIRFKIKVEDVTETGNIESTIEIDNSTLKNCNGYVVQNNSTRTSDADYYKLNDYNLKLDEYISTYNHEMMDYNNSKGFTSGEASTLGDRLNLADKANNPLAVEKYETLVFSTKVTNNATGETEYGTKDSCAKYATRVRPTAITEKLDTGLERIAYSAVWYNSAGTKKQDVSISSSGENNNYTYTISDNNILLSPGEYIIYYTTVKVKESNMCLDKLETKAQITTLTNINRNDSHTREVANSSYNRNISTKQADSDYIKLKDLVIAGTVWLDENKDGYMNAEESRKSSGVTVKLYKNNSLAETRTIGKNGFYTFGRQPKADSKGNYYKYYVEFEYDGIKYKATEVYGGENDGEANGTGNLNSNSCETCSTLPNEKWNVSEFVDFINKFPGWEVCSNCTHGFDGELRKKCSICSSTEKIVWRCDDHKTSSVEPENWRQGSGILGDTSGTAQYMTDSNAYEFDDVRNNFNKEYQTIGFNKSYIGTDSVNDLAYTKDGHISTINENPERIMTARSFINQNYSKTVNSTDSKNTNYLFLYDYKGHSNESPETEYLKYINLGLAKREEVDLSIKADVSAVKTTVNGEEMTYQYDDNHENEYVVGSPNNLDLYNADNVYKYDKYYKEDEDVKNYKGAETELNIEVTYKLTITNEQISNDEPNMKNKNIPVKGKAEQIAIYYDPSFMTFDKDKTVNVKVKNSLTGLLENKSLDIISPKDKILTSTSYTTNSDKNQEGYGVVYLDLSSYDYLSEGKSQEVEVTFIVKKDYKRQLDLQGSDLGHDIVAEISAYSTKYDNYRTGLTESGLIDRDSNPGNLGEKDKASILNSDYYEDDTYRTGITINSKTIPKEDVTESEVKRSISGIVWDDARTETVGTSETGIQYIGNGQYNIDASNHENALTNPKTNGKEKPISGVKVSLWEIVQTEEGKYYEYQAKDSNGNKIEAITDKNGEYTLSDYIPGYYKVRFDYGYDYTREDNVIYNGQDYKSTTYYNGGYYIGNYETDNIGSKNNFDYFDKVKYELNIPNKSDAQDDEIRRLNVNSYSETMTTVQAQIFAESEKNNAQAKTLTNNTKMYADSTIFYAKPDKVKSAETSIEASVENFNQERLWKIDNLDFGLEYRPEASVVLDKNIETLEIVTSDNKTLVKLYFEDDKDGNRIINENKSKGYENVQFLANSDKEQQGFVYVNMDTEILEGCTVKVDYEMETENRSEVDRVNKNLDTIKFESNASTLYSTKLTVSGNYSANGTASEWLASKYYKDYKFNASTGTEKYKYLTQLKKPYSSSGTTTIDKSKNLTGIGYYGMYLGETYYTGNVGKNDTVAQLKVDQILDYVDNDFVFSSSENDTKNRTWRTTTTEELLNKNVLDEDKVLLDEESYLIDKKDVRYETDNRSNLLLSVDSNKKGNVTEGNISLSRFLNTKNATKESTDYTGKINVVVSKVLSSEDVTNGTGLNYENISEVVQYTSLTGRRTILPKNGKGGILGNANVKNWNGYEVSEDDTDAAEVITIAPPTGLVRK